MKFSNLSESYKKADIKPKKRTTPKSDETFMEKADEMISKLEYDEDDFKIDMMEVLGSSKK